MTYLLAIRDQLGTRLWLILYDEYSSLDVGDAKLFDLGLAKELKPKDLVEPPNGYEASGMTGSRRYMVRTVW